MPVFFEACPTRKSRSLICLRCSCSRFQLFFQHWHLVADTWSWVDDFQAIKFVTPLSGGGRKDLCEVKGPTKVRKNATVLHIGPLILPEDSSLWEYSGTSPSLQHGVMWMEVNVSPWSVDFFLGWPTFTVVLILLRTMLELALTSLSWDIPSTISARHVQRWGNSMKKLTFLKDSLNRFEGFGWWLVLMWSLLVVGILLEWWNLKAEEIWSSNTSTYQRRANS